jgi:signal transduction histidine kinase
MLRVSSVLMAGGARRIAVVGAALIALTIFSGVFSIFDLRRAALDASRENMANLGVVLAEQLSRSMQAVDLVLGETVHQVTHSDATTPEEFRRQMASEATHGFLIDRLQALPQAGALFVADADGMAVNSSNYWPALPLNNADRDYFHDAQNPFSRSLIISAPSKSRATGRWTWFLGRRIESPGGVFLGAVVATIELGYFEEFYKTITLLDGASVSVMNRDGLVIVRHPAIERIIGSYIPKESPWYDHVAAGGGTYESPGYLDGVTREVAVATLKDYPVVVSVTVPERTALAAWRRQALFIGAGTVCGVIVFAILFAILAVQFGRLERSEHALSRALARSERADRAKSDFLGRMSHELRTPLNAIIGFSEAMTTELFGPLGSARYREYADDIRRSGCYLHELISDMLDMVKIEAGRRSLQPEKFDCAEELDETLRMIRPRAEAGEVTVGLDAADAPRSVSADRRAFKQIALNLIGNAVKFTQPGGKVAVRLVQVGDDAVLQVIDTGMGIAAANLAKLGTPFFRIEDNPRQANIEGTGLGVALTKSLVELHGWRLDFISEVGCGTTATVTMTAAVPPPQRSAAPPLTAAARQIEPVA